MTTYINVQSSELKGVLNNLFPHVILEKITSKIWTEPHSRINRGISPELITEFGDLATVWNDLDDLDATVNTDAKWDFYCGYHFKYANDAIFFKLKYM